MIRAAVVFVVTFALTWCVLAAGDALGRLARGML